MSGRPKPMARPRGVRARAGAAALAVLALGVIGATGPAPPAPARVFRIAMMPELFGDLGVSDAESAVHTWGEAILKQTTIHITAKAQIVGRADAIIDGLRRGELDAVGIGLPDYASVPAGLLDPRTVWVNEVHGRLADQYLLLVNRDAGIRDVSQLRGRRIVLWKQARMALARPWLRRMAAERGLGPPDEFLAGAIDENKVSKTALQVFFRQADGCVLTTDAFQALCELNPQVQQRLVPVATSPPLVASVLAFRAGCEPQVRAEVESSIQRMRDTAAGRQLLTVFGFDRIVPLPVSELEPSFALLRPTRGPIRVAGAERRVVPSSTTPAGVR